MVSSTLFTACALVGMTLAAPAPAANAASKKFNVKVHIPKAAHPTAHSHFDGTYVQFYHTGAGTNDAQLVKEKPTGLPAYINGTDLVFVPKGSNFPYQLDFYPQTAYTIWNPVSINVGGSSDTTFAITSSGITANKGENGWLACDWSHGVPQLFQYDKQYLANSKVAPSQNCEFAQLIPEYI